MSNTYAADARETLATLKEDGGPLTYTVQTGGTFDPSTDTWTNGTPKTVTTYALQEQDVEEKLAQLRDAGITVTDPIKLMVGAIATDGLPVKLSVGASFVWGGRTCVVRSNEPFDPSGSVPIFLSIVASRGNA